MFIAAVIVSIVFALVLVTSGSGKLAGQQQQLATMRKVGFPEDRLWLLAIAEFAGAAGLVIGLFWWPLGVAAAIGLILYFIGALTAHLRVRDPAWPPAAGMFVVAVAALVLRVATA